jgi:hypothetical protein
LKWVGEGDGKEGWKEREKIRAGSGDMKEEEMEGAAESVS